MARTRSDSTEKGPHAEYGARFQRALESAKLWNKTYEEIGKLLDVSGTTVGNLLNGKKLPSSELSIKIARLTHTNIDWLMTGRGELSDAEPKSGAEITNIAFLSDRVGKIPLISMDQAKQWCRPVGVTEGADRNIEYISSPIEHSGDAFCVRVVGGLMDDGTREGYPDGSIAQFEPCQDADHDDDVLIDGPNGNTIFRRIMDTGEGRFLVAINPDVPNRITQMSDGARVFARCTGHIIYKAKKR